MPHPYRSAVALLLICVVAGCGQATPGSGDGSASEESAAAFEAELIQTMVGREEAVVRPGKLTFAELFPASGQSEDLADAFRASVLSVDVGRTFTDNVDENYEVKGPVHEVPFDDPRADWRSFEVRVKVAEAYWGDVTAGKEVTIGLAFTAQTEVKVVTEGFASMGQFVVFTARRDFVVPYDPAVIPVLWDGAFLSPIEGERVPWPVLSDAAGSSGASMVSHFDTLSELRRIRSS